MSIGLNRGKEEQVGGSKATRKIGRQVRHPGGWRVPGIRPVTEFRGHKGRESVRAEVTAR